MKRGNLFDSILFLIAFGVVAYGIHRANVKVMRAIFNSRYGKILRIIALSVFFCTLAFVAWFLFELWRRS